MQLERILKKCEFDETKKEHVKCYLYKSDQKFQEMDFNNKSDLVVWSLFLLKCIWERNTSFISFLIYKTEPDVVQFLKRKVASDGIKICCLK
jgi:hypothetical protein